MTLAALLAAALPAAGETPSEKADALLGGLVETNDPGLAFRGFQVAAWSRAGQGHGGVKLESRLTSSGCYWHENISIKSVLLN